jgi:hypothetical protein
VCGLVLFESFRLVALLVATICTAGAVFRIVPPFGVPQILSAAIVGSVIFGAANGGSVVAVNYCAGARLEAFDVNADGVFAPSEQREGFVEAEALAVGDSGRNFFALASPVVGAVFAMLLSPIAWLFARVRRRNRSAR